MSLNDKSAKKQYSKISSKWKTIGYASIAKSEKSVCIEITSTSIVQCFYLGIHDLKQLLSGDKKLIKAFIPEEG